MLEGRGNTSGWIVVGVAIAALLVFAGLLFVRGGNGPRTLQTGNAPTSSANTSAASSARPSGSALAAAGSGAPTASRAAASPGRSASPAPSGLVAGATSPPSVAPTHTPKPAATPKPSQTPKPSPTPSQSDAVYRLPHSPQAATVALENGQGDCPNFPTGGVLAQTMFTQSASGALTAISPSSHHLTGRIQANGSFSVSGPNPVERWVGTLTATGGTGSYFVVSNGCTEGYETTIAFGP